MDEDSRAQRAARRADWTIHRGHRPALASETTAEERLAMMWQLAVDAWVASGRELPTYSRSTMPGRLVCPGGDGA